MSEHVGVRVGIRGCAVWRGRWTVRERSPYAEHGLVTYVTIE